MKAILTLLILLATFMDIPGQLLDDFSDGSLAHNPGWAGDTSHFVVNQELMLQLNAPAAGQSLIYTALPALPDNWRLSIDCRLDFNPSASNFLRLYIFIDHPDPAIASGYLIELGESGDQDNLRFYLLDNGQLSLLGTGISVYGVNPAFQLEVWKSSQDWQIFTTDLHNGIRTLEIDYAGNTPDRLPAGYFALSCHYTESRRDRFFFDNLSATAEILEDTVPPALLSLEISTPRQLILEFSEQLDPRSATNPDHYLLLPRMVKPDRAVLLADPALVQLELSQDLTTGDYRLEINNIQDIAGNQSVISYPFSYRPEVAVEPYDVLINEIFDDPTPVIGLPEAEFIELFINRNGLNLRQIMLQVGTSIVPLPDKTVDQGQYVVLYDMADAGKFVTLPNSIGIEKLPALLNSGNSLRLLTSTGKIIHTVSYDDSWYRNTGKADGGWSLELINPSDPCALSSNWVASQSLSGGTPGRPNSVLDQGAEKVVPQVLQLIPPDSLTIQVQLNKMLLESISPAQMLINPPVSIGRIDIADPNFNKLILNLDTPLKPGITYQVSNSLRDCNGNEFSPTELPVLIPEKIEPGDLLINEILFDPVPGGDDFVEILNTSSKALSLSGLHIANTMNSKSIMIRNPFLILPGNLIVITPNAADLRSRYTVKHPEWLLENELPNFNNDAGNITLYTTEGGISQVIDAFDYHEDMHHALLKEKEGVSLERISPVIFGQQGSNWHSAARESGYATPTALNSQYFNQSLGSLHWEVSPTVFSPDGDGFEDYTLITYQQLVPGSYGHIKIFDAAGRLVRYLLNNQSLATTGAILWDGTTDGGTKAPVGIYTVYIQVFDLTGSVREIKETCVVAARLN
jgi:hypothetical protein